MIQTQHKRQSLGSQFVISAKLAQKSSYITFRSNGEANISYKNIQAVVPIENQFPLIMPMYQDLSKALSLISNSPVLSNALSLREEFDREFEKYVTLLEKEEDQKRTIPYGNYFYDSFRNNLYHIPPEKFYRLSLVTNNAKLLTDEKDAMTWSQIRAIFDDVVVGFLGASVGGNILEGVMREIRPKQVKIADLDWIEATNLNRLERGNLEYLVQSKAMRSDINNPYDIPRINKAEHAAYQQKLIDPFLKTYVYPEGVHENNIDTFLLGSGKEPKIDVLIEEVDDFRMKVNTRILCKKYKIPLIMISDFGHTIQCQFHDFRKKNTPLGYQVSDKYLQNVTNDALSKGSRESRFQLIEALCGDYFKAGTFGKWVRGEGEQPTSSIPQSGATAMITGGLGAKMVARLILGHRIKTNAVFDAFSFSELQ